MIRMKEESETSFARSFLLEGALCWKSKLVSNDGNLGVTYDVTNEVQCSAMKCDEAL